jgi:hypothetical protein
MFHDNSLIVRHDRQSIPYDDLSFADGAPTSLSRLVVTYNLLLLNLSISREPASMINLEQPLSFQAIKSHI